MIFYKIHKLMDCTPFGRGIEYSFKLCGSSFLNSKMFFQENQIKRYGRCTEIELNQK